jgi:hypothetical protein
MRFELTTFSLARKHSTTELLPRINDSIGKSGGFGKGEFGAAARSSPENLPLQRLKSALCFARLMTTAAEKRAIHASCCYWIMGVVVPVIADGM